MFRLAHDERKNKSCRRPRACRRCDLDTAAMQVDHRFGNRQPEAGTALAALPAAALEALENVRHIFFRYAGSAVLDGEADFGSSAFRLEGDRFARLGKIDGV